MPQSRAVIYARVSTDEQATNYSLPTQIDACRQYATEHDMTIAGEFTDDYTGSVPLERRPEGSKAYEMLKGDSADAIIVYRADRLGRPREEGDEWDMPPLIRALSRLNKEIHTVNRGRIGTSFADLLLAMMDFKVAGDERRNIMERTMRGKTAKLKAGKMMGGWPPFGYRFIDEKHEVLEIVEDEAAIVRQIFAWMTHGDNGNGPLSMWQIAAKLTELRVPTHRDRLGYKRTKFLPGTWSPTDVSRLLARSVYAGQYEYTFGGQLFSMPAPPIVTQETFDRANAMREQNAHFSTRNMRGRARYLVAGLIRCGCGCELGYVGHTDRRKRRWYVPIGKTTMNYVPKRCAGVPVPADEVEVAAVDFLRGATKQEAFQDFLVQMARSSSSVVDEAKAELARLEAEIEKCNAEAARLVDLVVSGDLVSAALAEKSAALDMRHAELVSQRDTKEAQIAKLAMSDDDVERYLQLRSDIEHGLEVATPEQMRAILRACGVEIVVVGESIVIRARAFEFVPKSDPIPVRMNVRKRKAAQ